ncbi:hypothetical protein QTP88_011563 [Uroleucon formosanum]
MSEMDIDKATTVIPVCTGAKNLSEFIKRTPHPSFCITNNAFVFQMLRRIGFTQLNKLSASLEIPCLSATSFSKYLLEFGYAVQDTAWNEMIIAGNEERQLALECGNTDIDGTPMCTVVADGQLSKRSYKTKYDALSGAASIIGYQTGKVLFGGIKNRFMIEKIECRNHLLRNYISKLKMLATKTEYPVTIRKFIVTNILRFRSDVTKAITYQKNILDKSKNQKIADLKYYLKNAPYHRFGQHPECNSYFCKGSKIGEINKIPEALRCGILLEIDKITSRLVNNSSSLIEDLDNNICEQFNSIINKYVGGKRINFSQSNNYSTRVKAAIISFNSRTYLRTIHKKIMNFSPGTIGKKFIKNTDHIRLNTVNRRILNNNQKRYRKKMVSVRSKGPDSHYGLAEPLMDTIDEDELQKKKNTFIQYLHTVDTKQIEIDTRDQNMNPNWFQERKIRLTTSRFDGLVGDQAIVEIKCPYTAKDSENSIDAVNNKLLSYYNITQENTLKLKNDHHYYYQVMGQLHITCRNEEKMVKKLNLFYTECILPEIVDPLYGKRLLISDIREPTYIKEKRNKMLELEGRIDEDRDLKAKLLKSLKYSNAIEQQKLELFKEMFTDKTK